MKPLPGWLRAFVTCGALLLLACLERRRPLRQAVEPKLRREGRNLAVAATSGIVLTVLERPLIDPLCGLVERRRWGLLKRRTLPRWLETLLAVVLLDYTLYAWHILTHKVPALWRFHLVHHVDFDMDASTALRFHFGEMAASVPFRALQVAAIGVSPLSFSLWQTLLTASILFHHSNLEIPLETERWLSLLIVTPRMHGIHHSIVHRETDSNWSSGLALWDMLHGSLLLNVPQREITIGVPAYRDPAELTFPKLVRMPFEPQREDWRLPNGAEPQRRPIDIPRRTLIG
ncbi:MAG: sterol desaturase family protein [Bryobacteraceae bacterium]